jgi:hypothetical protein
VKFERDCAAVLVPQGENVTLPAGSVGYITQSLGGSFTVFVEGNLFRIAGDDARSDRQAAAGTAAAGGRRRRRGGREGWCGSSCAPASIRRSRSTWSSWGWSMPATWSRPRTAGRKANIRMTLTAPGCGMGEILVEDVRTKVERVPTIAEADVELVFDPPWNQSMMSEAARLETGML